ncbi:MAG: hypothetical protein SF053_09985, partial [Bacteroidia bacterium]|nr:hypothetical protein [Bacteroidia bacterium]
AVRLPLTMYLPVVVADHTLPAWGVHIPGRPDGRGYAFLNHWLGVEVQTFRDMPAAIRAQISRYQPPVEEVPAAPEPQAQDDQATLIERFLAAPPRFQPRRIQPAAPAEPLPQVEASLSADDGWVTETLALLHLRQHNREEALRIYRKLRLLFPEKSTYFDARIQKIVEES